MSPSDHIQRIKPEDYSLNAIARSQLRVKWRLAPLMTYRKNILETVQRIAWRQD